MFSAMATEEIGNQSKPRKMRLYLRQYRAFCCIVLVNEEHVCDNSNVSMMNRRSFRFKTKMNFQTILIKTYPTFLKNIGEFIVCICNSSLYKSFVKNQSFTLTYGFSETQKGYTIGSDPQNQPRFESLGIFAFCEQKARMFCHHFSCNQMLWFVFGKRRFLNRSEGLNQKTLFLGKNGEILDNANKPFTISFLLENPKMAVICHFQYIKSMSDQFMDKMFEWKLKLVSELIDKFSRYEQVINNLEKEHEQETYKLDILIKDFGVEMDRLEKQFSASGKIVSTKENHIQKKMDRIVE
ncbi:hypothetical protein M0811_14837 [Anaeramoeba ignava]|uniref:Uncharacterized protein n=1 Tax=Anaeramoeba ignava TaxID=1746090 RepID=A0A9Q0LTG6_ANAIG|nr:hypothetical protein M0811_14837 [Anaeramoeba ignava]